MKCSCQRFRHVMTEQDTVKTSMVKIEKIRSISKIEVNLEIDGSNMSQTLGQRQKRLRNGNKNEQKNIFQLIRLNSISNMNT